LIGQDPTSLDRLHDLVVPPPTPWWPPAPGWLWLLSLLALAALVLAVRRFVRWQRNRYRREALAELRRIEKQLGSPENKGAALLDLSELLKRVAITAYGRTDVARLAGNDWFAYLDKCAGTAFNQGLGDAMARALYSGQAQSPGTVHGGPAVDCPALVAEARHWIRKHPAC